MNSKVFPEKAPNSIFANFDLLPLPGSGPGISGSLFQCSSPHMSSYWGVIILTWKLETYKASAIVYNFFLSSATMFLCSQITATLKVSNATGSRGFHWGFHLVKLAPFRKVTVTVILLAFYLHRCVVLKHEAPTCLHTFAIIPDRHLAALPGHFCWGIQWGS